MPTYAYQCRGCNLTLDLTLCSEARNSPGPCPQCHRPLHRRFVAGNLRTPRSWEPHYNASVGRVVSNNREFDEALKRGSEAASINSGIHHNFVRVQDPAEVGIDKDRVAEVAARSREYRAKAQAH